MLIFAAAVAILSAAHAELAPRPPLTHKQVADIDAFVQSELTRQHIPGAAVGIFSRGRILLAKGYGLADIELNVPVRPETIFLSGSVAKQFASMAIMMLVEEGKLSLDDSITKFFPEAPTSWKPILIKNLLSHTSGLSEYATDERTGLNGPFYQRLDFSEDELMKKVEALPIESAPGDKWAYRNTNYLILGILIHKLTGEPHARFLSERIFRPLGMESTGLIDDRDIAMNRASGYEMIDGVLKNQEWASPTFNSTADGGTLYFNLPDLAKWDAALYTTRLVSQASLDRMWTIYKLNDGTPNSDDYGFGWSLGEYHGHRTMGHNGAYRGFTCALLRYPDDGLTVVVLDNLAHANPGSMARVIAGLVEPAVLPMKLVPISDNDPVVAATLKTALAQAVSGADVRGWAPASFAADFDAAASKRLHNRLANVWPGGSLVLVRRKPASHTPTKMVSLYRLTKGDKSILVLVALGPDGKISDLAFFPDQPYE